MEGAAAKRLGPASLGMTVRGPAGPGGHQRGPAGPGGQQQRALRSRRARLAVGGTVIAVTLAGLPLAAALGVLPQMQQLASDAQTIPAATADIPEPYLTAYQHAASSVEPPIPWEILAGIGKVATDHGRRSPYDALSRAAAPDTNYPDVVPPIVAPSTTDPYPPALGGTKTSAARTLSLQTVAGAPNAELATDVNNLPLFLAAERQVESGGNYMAGNGGATGAYQYIDATWASEARAAGYPQDAARPARDAPPGVQDAVAAYNAQHVFAELHNWWWVAEAWYYPLWAGNPAEQDAVPYPGAGNTLTMAGYARKVYSTMAATTGVATAVGPAATPTGQAGPAQHGTGPLLLTPAAYVPGADLQDVATAADVLARAAAPVEQRTWQQLNLASSVVDEPLSDRDARRFWTEVIGQLPVAGGVGMDRAPRDQPSTGAAPTTEAPATAAPATTTTTGPGSGQPATTSPMARFAADLLTNLAVPVSATNIAALQAWASGEGSTAAFNPLDTTLAEPGSTPFNGNGGDPVENYPDYRTGLLATVTTLEPAGRPAPMYAGIMGALQAGTSTQAVEAAVAASPWGTRAFPDPAFAAAANFPGLPGSVPAGAAAVLADLAHAPSSAPNGTVTAGIDAQAGADAVTMAELYAGVITDPAPAAGAAYTPSAAPPAGYTIPAATPPQVTTAITTALAQLGKPYVFGAAGPTSYDCSGLVMAAYAAAGVSLPRTTYSQYLAGQPVPVGNPGLFLPGDLLFIMGADAQGSAPGHVGLYLGNGQVIDAPYTGAVVHISPLASWTSQLVAVRRLVTA